MGGHAEYKTVNYNSRITRFGSVSIKQKKVGLNGEDMIQKLQGNPYIFPNNELHINFNFAVKSSSF